MGRLDAVWADQISERIHERVQALFMEEMEQAKTETVPIQAFACGAVAGLLVTVAAGAGLLVAMRRGEPPQVAVASKDARSGRLYGDLLAALWGIMENEIGEPGVAAQLPWPDAGKGG